MVNLCLLTVTILLINQNKLLREQLSNVNEGVDESVMDILQRGDTVTPFSVYTLDGYRSEITYSDTTKKYLLLIFHTTCPACVGNLQQWNDIIRLVNNVNILGVSIHEPFETAQYVAQHNIDFPVYSTTDKNFVKSYKVRMVPSTIILNERKMVLQSWA